MKHTYQVMSIVTLVIVLACFAFADTPAVTDTSGTGNSYNSGNIYVDTTPPGGSAVLDGGQDQLLTPGTFSGIAPGSHNIRISKPGYQPYSADTSVSSGSTSNVIVTLSQVIQPGSISVNSDPKGTGFFIDDIYLGVTNQIVGSLSPGPHKLTIREIGYQQWEQTVQVVAAQITVVNAKLEPDNNSQTGDLSVTSAPAGASVYLNGDYKGVTDPLTPLDILDIHPGIYTLLLKEKGYQDYTTSVTIQAGTRLQVDAKLQPVNQAATISNAQIGSNPSGADVYINNNYVGITPLNFENVKSGNYTIEIRLTGYQPYKTTGQVTPGQNIVLNAALTPVPAPTTKAAASPVTTISAIGIACLGVFLVLRQERQ